MEGFPKKRPKGCPPDGDDQNTNFLAQGSLVVISHCILISYVDSEREPKKFISFNTTRERP
jgi:hypothetical protein